MRTKRTNKVLFVGGLSAGILSAAAFLFGLAVGAYRLPPYGLIASARNELTGQHEEAFYNDPLFRKHVSCPEDAVVVFGMGQSNASNTNSSVSSPVYNHPVYNFFEGNCYILQDPVLGADSYGGSIWPHLASELSAFTDKPVVVAVRAKSGSAIGRWLPPSRYTDSVKRELERLAEANLEPELFIWFQGETDAAEGIDTVAYEKSLALLVDTIAPKSTWLVVDTSVCGKVREKYVPLGLARERLMDARSNIIVGPDTDVLGDRFRHDSCHFNWLGKKAVVEGIMETLSGTELLTDPEVGHIRSSEFESKGAL
ncbi:sialate O-acetylesterase [Parvularcula dongshanensis]|uniref:Sialate O-acetylesterase domain-containing protein n=1 Tax=Parvularcula dongshanensis TaxID=1173995 RepID=A0A840I337_9PROT|nr:sialate O-acetylesterase [Parvularcula dongshanensis]MBB4658624.1 hypothetical protein [Parvularcula dongshanensis]